ncbi:SDR family NAD(P)-dependent oxidoreductase, partial [Streptomyces sp. SID3343]|uniref:SDR family NAD(P)-dependent oxidoreductase n=1 Tax=Streptomyces sp. SID3343 TaxID=2690260 RepID=UPI00136B375C
LATVLELARNGIDTVATVRTAAKADAVTLAATEAGVRVRTVRLDVADPAGCREVVARIRPDILVNNAGSTCFAPVFDVLEEEARHHLEVALFGPLRLARFALPHMRERGWGRIVQISSLAGKVTYPLLGWYQAGKHAMEAVSEALRLEVARSGVDVVVIAPGGFRSGVTDDMSDVVERYRGSPYARAFQRMDLGFHLMKPLWSDPETIARVITDAVTVESPRAKYVVGADARLTMLLNRAVEPFSALGAIREGAVRKLIGLP